MRTLWLLPADDRFRVIRGAKAHADAGSRDGARVTLCGLRPAGVVFWQLYSLRRTRRCCGVCLRILASREGRR